MYWAMRGHPREFENRSDVIKRYVEEGVCWCAMIAVVAFIIAKTDVNMFPDIPRMIKDHNNKIMSAGENEFYAYTTFEPITIINPGRFVWKRMFTLYPCDYKDAKFDVRMNFTLSSDFGGDPTIRMINDDGVIIAFEVYETLVIPRLRWFSATHPSDVSCNLPPDIRRCKTIFIEVSWATTSLSNHLVTGGLIIVTPTLNK